jgi:hypothetical protein
VTFYILLVRVSLYMLGGGSFSIVSVPQYKFVVSNSIINLNLVFLKKINLTMSFWIFITIWFTSLYLWVTWQGYFTIEEYKLQITQSLYHYHKTIPRNIPLLLYFKNLYKSSLYTFHWCFSFLFTSDFLFISLWKLVAQNNKWVLCK